MRLGAENEIFAAERCNWRVVQVVRKITVKRGSDGSQLISVLATSLGFSKKKAKELLNRRDVFVNGRRVWMARHRVGEGDEIEVVLPPRGTGQQGKQSKSECRVQLLYRDKWFAIANKRPGMLACGAKGVEKQLAGELKTSTLFPVHRLDKDTSGCLVFALNADARDRILALFRKREIEKEYHAIAERKINSRRRQISRSLSGKRAVTRIAVVDANAKASHLSVEIETGRTHQIRKHLAGIRHPVVGDRVYGSARPGIEELKGAPRQMLHASQIAFDHPFTGKRLTVKAPLPGDFQKCLKRLRLR